MLVIGLLLAGAVAWLLERISQPPKDPHKRGDVLKRAQILAVAAVIAATGLGISLAKTPVVGQAIDQGTTRAAGFLSGVYDPNDPSGWSVPAKPEPTTKSKRDQEAGAKQP
jgi:hypothetical protein